MEDGRSRITAFGCHSPSSILNPPSSILDPLSFILYPRSSILIPCNLCPVTCHLQPLTFPAVRALGVDLAAGSQKEDFCLPTEDRLEAQVARLAEDSDQHRAAAREV
jgi:hypothetical protein